MLFASAVAATRSSKCCGGGDDVPLVNVGRVDSYSCTIAAMAR